MDKKYEKLFEPIKLGNGVESKNRFAMAPMLIFGSNDDDTLGKEDLDYFSIRNDTGGIIITGAASVSRDGHGMENQITAYDDDKVPGLKELASLIKEKGNLAIMQLHNAGRESLATYKRTGVTYAPSKIDFPFLDYVPEELSPEQVDQFIKDYGEATRRAIEAGFDGVEIHGANHYLIQQFFSAYSNKREDKWGGSFEKRMNFPLAVVDQVNEIVDKYADDSFIVGYRISPEEVHGENVGYTVDEVVKLIDKVIEHNVDYIHLSMAKYDDMPALGGRDEPITTTIYKAVDGRVPVMAAGTVATPDDALDALNYVDIVALGRAVIIDPDFVVKIRDGQEEKIETSVEGRFDDLRLPKTLKDFWQAEGSPLPPLKGL